MGERERKNDLLVCELFKRVQITRVEMHWLRLSFLLHLICFFKGVNQFLDKEIFVYGFLLNSVFAHPLKKNLMGSTTLRGEKESK